MAVADVRGHDLDGVEHTQGAASRISRSSRSGFMGWLGPKSYRVRASSQYTRADPVTLRTLPVASPPAAVRVKLDRGLHPPP